MSAHSAGVKLRTFLASVCLPSRIWVSWFLIYATDRQGTGHMGKRLCC